MKLFYSIILLAVLSLYCVTGCKKEKSYDIDFIIKNNYSQTINVIYKVKICSSINNGCEPQQFQTLVAFNSSSQLTVEDKTSIESPDIKSVFQQFEIYNNGIKSTYDFWPTSKISKTNYDDRIEYVLTVDSSFF